VDNERLIGIEEPAEGTRDGRNEAKMLERVSGESPLKKRQSRAIELALHVISTPGLHLAMEDVMLLQDASGTKDNLHFCSVATLRDAIMKRGFFAENKRP
jgi:hypothetical protein